MTKQTLRRKLARLFLETLEKNKGVTYDVLAETLADVALSEIREKPAFDKAQADPAWDILFGDRSQEEVNKNKLIKDALTEFERALRLPDSFNWYPNKKAEETAMVTLRNLVVEEYKKDKQVFVKYETWRRQPFSRGAISNATICHYPEKFVFSWSDFEANQTGSTTQNNSQVEVDDNGIPRTY